MSVNVNSFIQDYFNWLSNNQLKLPSKVFLPHDYIHVVTGLGTTPEEELVIRYIQRGGYLRYEQARKFWDETLEGSNMEPKEFTLKKYFQSLESYEQALKKYVPAKAEFFSALIEKLYV